MLGLDVGERRIGVAVSEGRLAVPLMILAHTNRGDDVARVAGLVRDQQAGRVVIGLPLMPQSGEEGEQARLVRRFGEALAAAVEVPIAYVDESYSSVAVDQAPARRRRRTQHIDDRAAAVILQSYIDGIDA